MRQTKNPQLQLGSVDIAGIVLDPKSRDDIPSLLAGLQYIYVTEPLREDVFKVLATSIGEQVKLHMGRTGMELWKILVLGTLRLNLNCDYDRLHELVNQHRTIRTMLGHGDWDDYDLNLSFCSQKNLFPLRVYKFIFLIISKSIFSLMIF